MLNGRPISALAYGAPPPAPPGGSRNLNDYLLVGTELHRFHHSADMREAKNYGVLTPVWDLVFGTFSYHPGQLPRALGVAHKSDYPASNEIAKVMLLPFRPVAPEGPGAAAISGKQASGTPSGRPLT